MKITCAQFNWLVEEYANSSLSDTGITTFHSHLQACRESQEYWYCYRVLVFLLKPERRAM